MAKQSILTDAKETVVEAGKTAAEGVKSVATDALVAGAAAAAGVVAERVSQGLRSTENKVQRAIPSGQEAARAAERGIKPAPRRKAAKKAAKSRSARAKKPAPATSKKKTAAQKAAATRKTAARKAGRKSAKRRTR